MKKKEITNKTKSRIKASLRKIWQYSGEYKESKLKYKVDIMLFKCNICKCLMYEGTSQASLDKYIDKYGKSVIMETGQLDHIEPVVDPKEGFRDWNNWIDRLFLNRMQYLCKPCHKSKSLDENLIRKAVRKLAKEKKK